MWPYFKVFLYQLPGMSENNQENFTFCEDSNTGRPTYDYNNIVSK